MSIGGSTDFLMTLIAKFVILVVAFLSVMVVRASFNKSLPSANLAATSNNDCVPSNENGCGAILFTGRVTIHSIVVAEQMGVTGTRSSRRRQVLLLVVGVTKCVDDDDADAGFNKMTFWVVVVSCFGGVPRDNLRSRIQKLFNE